MKPSSVRFAGTAALLAAAMILPLRARAVTIDNVNPPDSSMPGDRSGSATVDLEGKERKNATVWVYYSDNRNALNSPDASDPHGRASCRTTGNGKLTCSFLFPHDIHGAPNILTKTEIDGGEPPDHRPTFADVAAVPMGSPNPYVVTDAHPQHYGAPKHVFWRWVVDLQDGSATTHTMSDIQEFVMPRRLVIGLMGDSYSAGEGAPNVEGPTLQQRWDDEPCHRSSRSGHARAVKQFQRENPDVAVADFNATCSGADIDEGLLSPQEDYASGHNLKPGQIQALEDWMSANGRPKVDMLVMSIGGNNAGFGDAGISCLLNLLGDCRNDPDLWQRINQRLDGLPADYADLNARLSTLNIGKVFITEYPDPTRGANGKFCNTQGNAYPGLCWGPVEMAVSETDFQNLYQNLLLKLNGAVKDAATAFGWTYIGGTMDASHNHGLCNCDQGWFNTPGQALAIQEDIRGALHPNKDGYRNIYQPVIFNALQQQLKQMRRDEALAEAKAKARQETLAEENTIFIKQPTVLVKKAGFNVPPLNLGPKLSDEKLKAVPREKVSLAKDDDLDRQDDPAGDEGM